MKVTILQSDLNKWLSVVGRIVPNRGQLPILANVMLVADKDGLSLSATNLEIGLQVVAGGKVSEDGAITVPAKNFGELVNSLPPGNVELETDGEKLTAKGGKMGATFTGIAASEFPVISKLNSEDKNQGKIFKLSKKIIQEVAAQVAFAAATDESRPVLTGIKFAISEKQLIVIGTDGFRLSKKTVELDEETELLEKEMILPAKTIMEMARIVSEGKKEFVEMGMGGQDNQMIMGYENIFLTSRVLEGNFPDVEKIIPNTERTSVSVDKEEIVRAVKAMGIFARESANVVKFKISEGSLVVEASSSQIGEGKMEIEADKKGEDGQIAFNYRYVQDFLNSVSEERITLRMNESLTPGMFSPEKNKNLVHIIMPVRV